MSEVRICGIQYNTPQRSGEIFLKKLKGSVNVSSVHRKEKFVTDFVTEFFASS